MTWRRFAALLWGLSPDSVTRHVLAAATNPAPKPVVMDDPAEIAAWAQKMAG